MAFSFQSYLNNEFVQKNIFKGKKGNAKGTLAIINPLLTKSSEVTRNFYTTRVLKGKDLENYLML